MIDMSFTSSTSNTIPTRNEKIEDEEVASYDKDMGVPSTYNYKEDPNHPMVKYTYIIINVKRTYAELYLELVKIKKINSHFDYFTKRFYWIFFICCLRKKGSL